MLEVDKTTFEAEVLQAEGYVLVDFFGDGCVPCQALMPHVHAMGDTYGDKIKFTCLNTTKNKKDTFKNKCVFFILIVSKYYIKNILAKFDYMA